MGNGSRRRTAGSPDTTSPFGWLPSVAHTWAGQASVAAHAHRAVGSGQLADYLAVAMFVRFARDVLPEQPAACDPFNQPESCVRAAVAFVVADAWIVDGVGVAGGAGDG